MKIYDACIYYDEDILYSTSQYGGLKKSYDGGISWDNIKPVTYEGGWVTPYKIHPQNNNMMMPMKNQQFSANSEVMQQVATLKETKEGGEKEGGNSSPKRNVPTSYSEKGEHRPTNETNNVEHKLVITYRDDNPFFSTVYF